MRIRDLVAAFAATAALVAAATGHATGNSGHRPNGDVVREWNQLLIDTTPATLGLQAPRYFSMLHIAMFDAVNSIERDYTRYHVKVWASRGASTEAAAAQAAHDVLSALIPASKPLYDTALAARLAGIPPGRAAQGVSVGASVAQKILEWRTNDGWSDPPPPYVLPPFPGLWQPTPPGNAPPAATQFPGVEPFALISVYQFLPPLPPQINTPAYAEDFNEVKEIGAINSTTRTVLQSQIAKTWAAEGYRGNPLLPWFRVARDTSLAAGLSLIKTARLFAGVSVAINDSLQTTMSSKYVYGFWRPVTAIRRADEDLNDATVADPSWLPYLTTPPYPSYGGNVACVSSATATALGRAYGTDAVSFSITWIANPADPAKDLTRSYTSFWQAASEAVESRVYGGIHYRFDQESSVAACPQVGNWIFDYYMRPKHH